MAYRYVFGPVVSGRLGLSLGLDLLGGRICSMDCLYCEVGLTTTLTTQRKPYVPASSLLEELTHWRDHSKLRLDAVTLGGMGEPCLNSEIAQVIKGAKAILPGTPVAVLTNATMLTDRQVRADLLGADIVLPSLDSLVQEEFSRVCQPAPGITAAAVAQGILDFRQEFSGQIFLEVLLIAGINDTMENLRRLENYVRTLRPQRVDVVTMSRPGAYSSARAVGRETLAQWSQQLNDACRTVASPLPDAASGADPATAAAECPPPGQQPAENADSLTDEEIQSTVLRSLRRRPQTAAELACALGLGTDRVTALVRNMERLGLVRATGSAPHFGPASREAK